MPEDLCALCDPWINPALPLHRECLLAEVLGRVGHLLDHDHFCIRGGDPDAGLTRRQSALCVGALVERLGVEALVSGEFTKPPLDEVCRWAGFEMETKERAQ